MKTISATDRTGVFIGFVINTPARVTAIGFVLNGSRVFTHRYNAPDFGQVVRGFALSALGVPPGNHTLNIEAEDEDGCVGRTGALRTLTVTP